MKLGLMSAMRARLRCPVIGISLIHAGYGATFYANEVELPSGNSLYPFQDSYTIRHKV